MGQHAIKHMRLRKFRDDFSEAHLSFAGYASVPVVISIDLLYKLWLNFNMYADPATDKLEKIPYIVVSDLVLSQLCEPIGYKTFRINEEVREELQNNLHHEIKKQVGFFLKEYISRFFGSLENNVKSIHSLKADLILNPETLREELKAKIESKESDYNKANFVSLFLKEAGANDGHLNFITLVAAAEKSEDTIRMPVDSIIQAQLQPPKEEEEKKPMGIAWDVVRACLRSHSPVLDLGNCSLTDIDFDETKGLLAEINKCAHVTTLILSGTWEDLETGDDASSANSGEGNRLSSIPKVVLPNLKKIVCRGQTGSASFDPVSFSRFTQLEYLDLSENKISDTGYLRSLPNLVFLNLSSNSIIDISPLSALSEIQFLALTGNQISDISPLSRLYTLRWLHLQINQVSDLSPLTNIAHLERLGCRNNLISDVAPLKNLSKLEKISLRANRILSINPLVQLNNIRMLDVGSNLIKTIPAELNQFKVPLLWEEREQGDEKEGIFLIDNPLETPPVHVIKQGREAISAYFDRKFFDRQGVYDQYLREGKNRRNEVALDAMLIFSIPTQQTWLLFTSERIWFFLDDPETIIRHNCLQKSFGPEEASRINARIDTDGGEASIQIGNAERWYYSRELFPDPYQLEAEVEKRVKKILALRSALDRNPQIQIPDEIVAQGLDAIESYINSGTNTKTFTELNIVLLGDAGSGKTSLLAALVDNPLTQEPIHTTGINIVDYYPPSSLDVQIRFFDFGGQQIYSSLFRFFIPPQCKIVLVNDNRNSNDLDYWLNLIAAYGLSTQVYIAINKMDGTPSFEVARESRSDKYPFIRGLFTTSARSSRGVEELKNALMADAASLPTTTVPAAYELIRNELKAYRLGYIFKSELEPICTRYGLASVQEQDELARYLTLRGGYYRFSEPSTDSLYVSANRLMDGLGMFLDSQAIRSNGGRFSRDEINDIYNRDDPPNNFSRAANTIFLDMLVKLDLCFEIPENKYLIPSLLPVEMPIRGPIIATPLGLSIAYDFFPQQIIYSLIRRLFNEIEDNIVWQNGLYIRSAKYRENALIIADPLHRTVAIYTDLRRVLFEVRNILETIHGTFSHLGFFEEIKLPYSDEFIRLDTLRKYKLEGKDVIESSFRGKPYSVDEVLQSIDLPKVYDVFVVTFDSDKKIVSEINNSLSRQNFTVAGFQIDLSAREEQSEMIREQIAQSKAMIICISKRSLEFHWFQVKLDAILKRFPANMAKKDIYPIVLDDTPIDELQAHFSDLNYVRYNKETFQNLATEIAKSLRVTPVAEAPTPTPTPTATLVRIFVASNPGIGIIINQLEEAADKVLPDHRQANFEFIYWDKFTRKNDSSDKANRNDFRKEIERCELFLGFVSKMVSDDASTEYGDAFHLFLKTGKPIIYTYFIGQSSHTAALEPFKDKLTRAGHLQFNIDNNRQAVSQFASDLKTYVDDLSGPSVESKIESLANEYLDIRKAKKFGNERTAQMASVIEKIMVNGAEYIPWLSQLTESTSAGKRLIAIITLQRHPNVEYLNWLSAHVGDAEQHFVGYQSSIALFEAARRIDNKHKSEIGIAIDRAIKAVNSSKRKDPNQQSYLNRAKEIISDRAYSSSIVTGSFSNRIEIEKEQLMIKQDDYYNESEFDLQELDLTEDFIISGKVIAKQAYSVRYGLAFNYKSDDDFMIFTIHTSPKSNSYSIGYANSLDRKLSWSRFIENRADFIDGKSDEMRMEKLSDRVNFYINGHLVYTDNAHKISENKFAFWVADNANILFSNWSAEFGKAVADKKQKRRPKK